MTGNYTVPGWSELMQADIGGAIYASLQSYLLGHLLFLLFIVGNTMLYMKARNVALNIAMSLIFLGVFYTYFSALVWDMGIMILIIVGFVAGALYSTFAK